jgi:hypothetical protein
MSDSDEVKVGSFNKVPKRPVPNGSANGAAAPVAEASNADISAKLDQMNKHLQAIDWKMWVYLKANNYID